MDKLGPVREILTQNDDGWEDWGLEQLVEKLQKYIERNPLNSTFNPSDEQVKFDKKNANVQSRSMIIEALHSNNKMAVIMKQLSQV